MKFKIIFLLLSAIIVVGCTFPPDEIVETVTPTVSDNEQELTEEEQELDLSKISQTVQEEVKSVLTEAIQGIKGQINRDLSEEYEYEISSLEGQPLEVVRVIDGLSP